MSIVRRATNFYEEHFQIHYFLEVRPKGTLSIYTPVIIQSLVP